jgi:hypothetical protein
LEKLRSVVVCHGCYHCCLSFLLDCLLLLKKCDVSSV